MGNEFLSGYIKLAESEKDPRNLLLTLAIARVILVEFDITNHVEVRTVTRLRTNQPINPPAGIVHHHFLLFSYHFPTPT